MAQLFQQPFDAHTVQPREAFEALPAGWYNARISASEAKPGKDPSNGLLSIELEILDGEYKGRKVWDRLNLWYNTGDNAEKVREIAHRQLSAYCHATGVFLVQDSQQLHNIPIKIRLAVRQDQGYEAANDIKAVKHIQDTVAPTAAPAAPSFPAQPAAPAGFTPPTAPAAPTPFGMNPALPAQPAPVAAPVQPSPPWGQPLQTAPVAQPQFAPPQAPAAQPAFAPAQQAAPPWGTPAAPTAAPAPAGGPVPPWRR